MKIPLGIENVLNQPMSRKEFLRTIGMMGVVVLGAGYFSKLFETQGTRNSAGTAYGIGTYGGSQVIR